MPHNLGFSIEIPQNTEGVRFDAFLFGESQSRIVVSVKESEVVHFEHFMNERKGAYSKLGRVMGERISVNGEGWGNITTWKKVYDETLGDIMNNG